DSRSGALARRGIVDENVFEIETGVCILLGLVRQESHACDEVDYSEVIGTYEEKAALLLASSPMLREKPFDLDDRRYKSFLPSASSRLDEYSCFLPIDYIFGAAVDGVKTSRDGLVIANTRRQCAAKIQAFMHFNGSRQDVEDVFAVSCDKWDYKAAQ